mmetsp:Transcript_21741/g.30726  ORF Transcript_21741/g.30726 Transcript_21741/m.30726 type:complete len:82 (+) Transcript_21741:49-294(+)
MMMIVEWLLAGNCRFVLQKAKSWTKLDEFLSLCLAKLDSRIRVAAPTYSLSKAESSAIAKARREQLLGWKRANAATHLTET